jgi:HPt (histidine-containing phosphotransfer) domain-containing protein
MAAPTLKEDQTQAIAIGMNENDHPASRPPSRAWQEQHPTAPLEPAAANQPADLEMLRQQIDWERLHQLSNYSAEFEWELLQVFADDSCAYLAHLKQAIALQDYGQIEQDAHHIKGASANVGAMSMQTAAAALEQQARAKHLEDSDRWIQLLETALTQLQLLVRAAPS